MKKNQYSVGWILFAALMFAFSLSAFAVSNMNEAGIQDCEKTMAGCPDSIDSDTYIEFDTVQHPDWYTWEPQKDITAYELALCIGPIVRNDAAAIPLLPPEARRHWKKQ